MEKKFWYIVLFVIIAYISYDIGYHNGRHIGYLKGLADYAELRDSFGW